MKRFRLLPFLVICLLLGGCSWGGGSYVSITPAVRRESEAVKQEAVLAADYEQLRSVVAQLVADGKKDSVIYVVNFDRGTVENNMENVRQHILETDPIGAYALEELSYQVGTQVGRPAIAMEMTYRLGRVDVDKIRRVSTMAEAEIAVGEALESMDSRTAICVDAYEGTDFTQVVRDYAEQHPQTVMEIPYVTEGIYGGGKARVVELTFSYQTSRESMRQMQTQVQPVFHSADLYVSGEGSVLQKYSQLCTFLMERFDYKLETSITPAYSLLRHGVGDSRAFAITYSAMCRQAGMECLTVAGTRGGEPWNWNIIRIGGYYRHVDLQRCSEAGYFFTMTDREAEDYVWDYSAYPKCPERIQPTEKEDPEETEPTVPQETEPQETKPEETKPTETKPTRPPETEETEPPTTRPPKPSTPAQTEPTVTRPSEPEETEDTQPPETESRPEQSTKPAPTEPETQPETEETEPSVPESTQPGTYVTEPSAETKEEKSNK